MGFNNFSTGKKLGINVLITTLLVSCIILSSLFFSRQISLSFSEVQEQALPHMVAILEVKSIFKRMLGEINSYLLTGDPEEIREFNRNKINFDKHIQSWRPPAGFVRESKLRNELIQQRKILAGLANSLYSDKRQLQTYWENLDTINKQIDAFYLIYRTKAAFSSTNLDFAILAVKNIQALLFTHYF